ncbi:LysM domain-containing protein [Aeromicrobium alkaliterrae]|uniref:LysM domain-containing protein n=1 Tax=Aeromicrobium alkaliterrae TaxID=302168 RepID=A0ABN2JMS7_9ACTN
MSITHDELPLIDFAPYTRDTEQARERHLALVPHAAAPVRSAAVARPAAQPGLRLTRRGRVLLTILALAVVTALMVVFGSGTAATSDASAITGTTTITVQPGQTLWSIAGEANPGGDVRDTMDDIVKLNSLVKGETLQMGTQLALPVYAD